MRQVLFEIPFLHIPVFGYGVMLFVAIYVSMWLAGKRAAKNGGTEEMVHDAAFWLVISGILGARLFYVFQYHDQFEGFWDFFTIWRGGLVVYGSLIGGLVGFLIYTWRYKIPRLWFADILGPSVILGMAIGRIGCLLNGCCYGDYCPAPWGLSFPPGSAPHHRLVTRGYQSRLGFVVSAETLRVIAVEPGTPAEKSGLQVGDRVESVNAFATSSPSELALALRTAGVKAEQWERAKEDVELAFAGAEPFQLVVRRAEDSSSAPGQGRELSMTFRPAPTLPLHPTQVYDAISNLCLFAFLWVYYPRRRCDGEVIALMAMGYSVTRFLVEFLRFDESPLFDGLTISQNLSVVMLLVGLIVWVAIRGSGTAPSLRVAAAR
ncbi:MAG: prolipoprotein diacylglyceryl transferase family protein [Planctomycetota bacterium]